MNTYELTIVLKEDKEGTEKVRILKVVTDFAKKVKGEVNKQESWGVKQLAYLIKKQSVGEYEHFVLSLPSVSQPELDKILRLDESILRYMFVRV